MWDLKIMIQASLYMKQTDLQTETNLWLTKGKEGGGRINEEFCISRHKLLYIKYMNNKVLLCVYICIQIHIQPNHKCVSYIYTCIYI